MGEPPSAHVSVQFAAYVPATIDVLAADTITWTNDSVRTHTVTDDAAAYDSQVIPVGGTFAHRFDSLGSFTYHCRLHPYIRGEVDVRQLLLDHEPQPAQANQPFPLRGRAALPPNTAVTVEADDGSGAGFKPAAAATVGPDGHFTAVVTPANSAAYRAVSGDQVSPPVQVLVLNHSISASSRSGHRSSVVSVQVTPPDPHGTVVLQLHLRERFGWWPVGQVTLDTNSRAQFVLHVRRAVSARARLTLPDGATPLATSAILQIRPFKKG